MTNQAAKPKILIRGLPQKRSKAALALWPLLLYLLAQLASNHLNTTTTTTTTKPPNYHHDSTPPSSSSPSKDATSKTQQDPQPAKTNTLSLLAPYLPPTLLRALQNGAHQRPFILTAQASLLYQANQDRGVIILNSTNFNTELIQHRQPFPHVKLIEYYVSYSGICAKFKPTYSKLAREIYSWRNVIRPSAIDLSESSNTPIAHSWSVTVVPALRIHPPPTPTLAEKLDKQLSTWQATLPPSELQASMFREYNSSQLMIQSLNVANYMDKVQLLKSDLLRYIERYVSESPHPMPTTWPNLKPVVETRVADLLRNHPRQELFLLIEAPSSSSATATSDSNQSPSFGLSVMMDLSSSAAWKAVRYVRASENRALIEDVIKVHKLQAVGAENGSDNPQLLEQVELLNALISTDKSSKPNSILLVHIDDSHTPIRTSKAATALPYMTMITNTELVSHMHQGSLEANRAKRADNNNLELINQTRQSRSLFDNADRSSSEVFDKMSNEQKVELLASYIKQVYIETKEDREFVEAIANVNDKTEDISESSIKTIEKYIKSHHRISNKNSKQSSASDSDEDNHLVGEQAWFDKILSIFNPTSSKYKSKHGSAIQSDYDDKLKAIRYMLFTEVPRTSFNDKSLAKQQEKLNALVNLVSVIKTYFPLPDSSSIQFIDGVQNYLLKQQFKLSSSSDQQAQQQRTAGRDESAASFDTRAFKQELKRLESEDKRLPEVKEWTYCVNFGYPCALWRLFHTLVAFEYKKLNQIRQPSLTRKQPPPVASNLQQPDNNLSPSVEAITMKSIGTPGHQSPVERLVSPPSTTTSLSLTIAATPIATSDANTNNKPLTEADLPTPVILVMRDYITNFYSCEECRRHFRQEAADLSLERIRHQEEANFSLIWLWDAHNRVNKRLAMDTVNSSPKVWFPTYEQCSYCYNKPPSFNGKTVDQITMFQEPIDWNKQEIVSYLLREYTKHPLDNTSNLFGYPVNFLRGYVLVAIVICVVLCIALRCTTYYIERQRRHKVTLLNGNGNGAHYSPALQ